MELALATVYLFSHSYIRYSNCCARNSSGLHCTNCKFDFLYITYPCSFSYDLFWLTFIRHYMGWQVGRQAVWHPITISSSQFMLTHSNKTSDENNMARKMLNTNVTILCFSQGVIVTRPACITTNLLALVRSSKLGKYLSLQLYTDMQQYHLISTTILDLLRWAYSPNFLDLDLIHLLSLHPQMSSSYLS